MNKLTPAEIIKIADENPSAMAALYCDADDSDYDSGMLWAALRRGDYWILADADARFSCELNGKREVFEINFWPG